MRNEKQMNAIEQMILKNSYKPDFLCFVQALLYLRLGYKITRFELRFPYVFYLHIPNIGDTKIVCENLHTGEKNEDYHFDMFEMMQENFIIYEGKYKY